MVEVARGYAPAKINIGLRVFPEVKDGFHQIESIFVKLSFGDELKIFSNDGGFNIVCNQFKLPENNTLVSAYNEFYSETGLKPLGLTLELAKKIPQGGGLGGGSSDAATFVMLLEHLHGVRLSEGQKKNIASKIGSDVFFFLLCQDESAAIVTGRGQDVLPFRARDDLHFVLLFPGVASSTKEAYSLVDEYYASYGVGDYPSLCDLQKMYEGDVTFWKFKNSFTLPIAKKFPEIWQALNDIEKSGAVFSDLSGSGSTVYGVFPSKEEAENASRALAHRWKNCVVAHNFSRNYICG